MSNYTYTDSEGDTLILQTDYDVVLAVKEGDNPSSAVFMPPEAAIKLAMALVSTIPDYNHDTTLHDNDITSLDRARNEVMESVGISQSTFQPLTDTEKKLIDAIIEGWNLSA